MNDFHEALHRLGFHLSLDQTKSLFKRYENKNATGVIDLSTFRQHILLPDYTGDGDHWVRQSVEFDMMIMIIDCP
jgi:hypothetical protein